MAGRRLVGRAGAAAVRLLTAGRRGHARAPRPRPRCGAQAAVGRTSQRDGARALPGTARHGPPRPTAAHRDPPRLTATHRGPPPAALPLRPALPALPSLYPSCRRFAVAAGRCGRRCASCCLPARCGAPPAARRGERSVHGVQPLPVRLGWARGWCGEAEWDSCCWMRRPLQRLKRTRQGWATWREDSRLRLVAVCLALCRQARLSWLQEHVSCRGRRATSLARRLRGGTGSRWSLRGAGGAGSESRPRPGPVLRELPGSRGRCQWR